jgi:membrane protein DedA with SNARE-associated domain
MFMNLFEVVEQLFDKFGYLVLLFGLPLDFIALPIPPGNSTLTYTGYLSYKGVLNWIPALVMAFAGAILGVTITYSLGYKLGMPLIERYGKFLSLNSSSLDKTRNYYDKYGNKLLLIGFFIPGVRQFIGYFIGIIRIPYHTLATYAYTGVALWVISFFSIGFIFGEQWQRVFLLVEEYLKYSFLVLGFILIFFLFLKWIKRKKDVK